MANATLQEYCARRIRENAPEVKSQIKALYAIDLVEPGCCLAMITVTDSEYRKKRVEQYGGLIFVLVANGRLDLVKSFINIGGDCVVADAQGRTPLDLAMYLGYTDIFDFLLLFFTCEENTDVYECSSPFFYCYDNDHFFNALLPHFPSWANNVMENGYDIISFLCTVGRLDRIHQILEKDAEFLKCEMGDSLQVNFTFEAAMRHRSTQCFELLKEFGFPFTEERMNEILRCEYVLPKEKLSWADLQFGAKFLTQ